MHDFDIEVGVLSPESRIFSSRITAFSRRAGKSDRTRDYIEIASQRLQSLAVLAGLSLPPGSRESRDNEG